MTVRSVIVSAGALLLAASPLATAQAASPAGIERGAWPEPPAEAVRAWSGAPMPAPVSSTARRAVPAKSATPELAASAPPRAPAPAWRFIGRIVESGSARAMLLTPQQLRVVAEQDALDADWRVERIGEQGVDLLWLPGAQRVRLAWAAP